MKKIIYFLFTITLFSTDSYSQERDSLIQLYPGMGDTLDCIDREIFGLYPDIDGFKYAQIFVRDRKFLISKISHLNNGTLKDTLLVEDYYQLYFLRQNLSKFISDNDKRYESPLDAFIFTNAGNNYNGKLKMFSKSFLFLNSDINYFSGDSSPFNFRTPILKVDSLTISMKKNVAPYVGYGALGGFTLGFIVGIATFEDDMGADKEVKWLVTGGIGSAVGALLGWLIGESLPKDKLTFRFATHYDVTKLKDHAAYYFHYSKSIEEKYVELE